MLFLTKAAIKIVTLGRRNDFVIMILPSYFGVDLVVLNQMLNKVIASKKRSGIQRSHCTSLDFMSIL